MKTKLNPDVCYMAGLMNKHVENENSAIGVRSASDAVIERFVLKAIGLGIKPNKIVVSEEKGAKHVLFYHSKLARMARSIREKETRLFRERNELSANYVAGMFDATGRLSKGVMSMKMDASDQLMLENLGVHTFNSSITSIGSFITLIKGFSALLDTIQLPGNERDPR